MVNRGLEARLKVGVTGLTTQTGFLGWQVQIVQRDVYDGSDRAHKEVTAVHPNNVTVKYLSCKA